MFGDDGPTEEDKLYFGEKPSVTKHTFLHQILRSNYTERFYQNCFELRQFENNSFYLKLINDINNLEKFKFEKEQVFYYKVECNLFELYDYVNLH